MTTPASSQDSQIDQICEKVERLLDQHERLQHRNALLEAQVGELTQQHTALQERLSAARARVDALLDRLPPASSTPDAPVDDGAAARVPT